MKDWRDMGIGEFALATREARKSGLLASLEELIEQPNNSKNKKKHETVKADKGRTR